MFVGSHFHRLPFELPGRIPSDIAGICREYEGYKLIALAYQNSQCSPHRISDPGYFLDTHVRILNSEHFRSLITESKSHSVFGDSYTDDGPGDYTPEPSEDLVSDRLTVSISMPQERRPRELLTYYPILPVQRHDDWRPHLDRVYSAVYRGTPLRLRRLWRRLRHVFLTVVAERCQARPDTGFPERHRIHWQWFTC